MFPPRGIAVSRTAVLVVLVLFSFVLTGGNSEDPPGQNPGALAAGLECFEQLDFECAIELLGAAAASGRITRNETLVDIYRKLAESHLALGQRKEAVDRFADLLRLDPGYRITSAEISPKILDALEEARERIKSETREPVPVVPPSLPEPFMELGMSGGAEFLVGEDNRLLDTGPAVELEANFLLGGAWRTGIGLRYAFHGVSASDHDVHAAGAWASFGGEWNPGIFALAAHAGVGFVHFGILNEEGKTGLWLPLRLCAGFQLTPAIHLGLVVSPGWLITFDEETRSSFTLSVGGRFKAAF
jgi:hypothetical protein